MLQGLKAQERRVRVDGISVRELGGVHIVNGEVTDVFCDVPERTVIVSSCPSRSELIRRVVAGTLALLRAMPKSERDALLRQARGL